MVRVEPSLMQELVRYGAGDTSACFDCGTCVATCPLSEDDDAFPRRMIRYARLGKADHLVASKELWLCHHCGECSESCPRDADPASFMAAARRYAIARFEPTGIARGMTLSAAFTAVVLAVLGVLFTAVLLYRSTGLPAAPLTAARMFDFVPFAVLHYLGIAVLGLVSVLALISVANMLWTLSRAPVPGGKLPTPEPAPFPAWAAAAALWLTVRDVFDHRRHRSCSATKPNRPPLLIRRWFVHLCIMGGFLGLGGATVLDYLFKDPDLQVPIWYPIRLLGIVSGFAFTYGTSVAIALRARHAGDKKARTAEDRYHAHTRGSDWLFLVMLWTLAVTGFALTLGIYLPLAAPSLYLVFLVHVVLAMELLVLLPFTKFAHAVYRPVAIWFQHFRRLRLAAPERR